MENVLPKLGREKIKNWCWRFIEVSGPELLTGSMRRNPVFQCTFYHNKALPSVVIKMDSGEAGDLFPKDPTAFFGI